jgi:hypothetical protein
MWHLFLSLPHSVLTATLPTGFTMRFTFTYRLFLTLVVFLKSLCKNQLTSPPLATEVATFAHHGTAQWKHRASDESSAASTSRLVSVVHSLTCGVIDPSFRAREATIATVLVGPDQISFAVHESLLIHYSKFFRAALTGHFSEARDKTVKLADENAGVFELFVHWLYYQRFPDKTADDDEGLWELWFDMGIVDAGTDQCIHLYVFGDKYDIAKLRLDTIDEVVRIALQNENYTSPSIHAIRVAFRDLPQDSPMCRLIIDFHYRYSDPDLYHKIADYDYVPFLQAVWRRYATASIKAIEANATDMLEENLKFCDYHDHNSDEERAACKKKQNQSAKCECSKDPA